MKNYFLKMKNESMIILICTIISLFVSVISFLFCIISTYSKEAHWGSLLFLIPPIILFVLNYFSIKCSFKNNKAFKIAVICLNLFIISAIQIIIGFILLLFIQFFDINKNYTNPEDYSTALKSIYAQDRVKHFPKELPKNAKNVVLYKYCNAFFGSEEIYIKFSTNKQYIDNEIKRHKYISIEPPTQYNHRFDMDILWEEKTKNDNEFTFYVINDRDNENLPGHYFPYHYGIGVDDQNNTIIFYYTSPD